MNNFSCNNYNRPQMRPGCGCARPEVKPDMKPGCGCGRPEVKPDMRPDCGCGRPEVKPDMRPDCGCPRPGNRPDMRPGMQPGCGRPGMRPDMKPDCGCSQPQIRPERPCMRPEPRREARSEMRSGCGCQDNRPDQAELLNFINEVSFAVNDILLYLDTHPCDEEALAFYRENVAKRNAALKKYAKFFSPLTVDTADDAASDSWTWVTSPWPWEGGIF